MESFLTGAGHFGFGFLSGTVIFILLILSFPRKLGLQIYSPFIPFVLGFLAALPYAFWFKETCEFPFYANVFYLYSWAHCNHFLITLSGNLHFVVLICACIYGFIILRYISLVRRVRRYGWVSKRSR